MAYRQYINPAQDRFCGLICFKTAGSAPDTSFLLHKMGTKVEFYTIPKRKNESKTLSAINSFCDQSKLAKELIKIDKEFQLEENAVSNTYFWALGSVPSETESTDPNFQWIAWKDFNNLATDNAQLFQLIKNKLQSYLQLPEPVPRVKDSKAEVQGSVDTRPFVVHCKKSRFDVYIGRPNPTIKSSDFKWGNPFKIGPYGNRDDVIRKYEEWIRSKPDLMEMTKRELKGKVLACWCAPEGCHGDVLAKIANFE